MGLGIIKEVLTMEQREVAKIFLPYIFLSLPRFAGLVTLGRMPALQFTPRRSCSADFPHCSGANS